MILTTRRAFSLVGMLMTLACMLVLSVITMTALNKAVTGEGSTKEGTVHSMKDKMSLYALHQSLVVHAMENRGRFVTPSEITGAADKAEDTTASLFSLMVMRNYTDAAQLISANEMSGYVWKIEDYDFRAYNPRDGVYWDPAFRADLDDLSNTSFAHVPLYGERAERNWKSFGSRFPLIGNRGPKDGVDDPTSWTYGKDGTWAAHVVYADGHIGFIDTFTPDDVYFERDGQRLEDNLFAAETGRGGSDAFLTFTKAMTGDGPDVQFD